MNSRKNAAIDVNIGTAYLLEDSLKISIFI